MNSAKFYKVSYEQFQMGMEKEDVKYIIAKVNKVSIPDVLKRKEKIE